MKEVKEGWGIAVFSILGVSLVTYGMIWRSHPIFLLGIGLVIVGYLRLRKKLKHAMSRRSR